MSPKFLGLVEACTHHKMLYENQNLDREEMLAIMEDVHHSLVEIKGALLVVCMSVIFDGKGRSFNA